MWARAPYDARATGQAARSRAAQPAPARSSEAHPRSRTPESGHAAPLQEHPAARHRWSPRSSRFRSRWPRGSTTVCGRAGRRLKWGSTAARGARPSTPSCGRSRQQQAATLPWLPTRMRRFCGSRATHRMIAGANVRFTPYAGINEKGGGEILRLHAAIDVIFRRHTALFCYRCGIPPMT